MKPDDLFSVKGKVALVTGCRRGIGHAFTVALMERGAKVYGIGKSVDSNWLEEYVVDLGYSFTYQQADLGASPIPFLDAPDIRKQIVDNVIKKYGRIDILINNAGAQTVDGQYDKSVTDMNTSFGLMAIAPYTLARAASKYMIAQKSGKIINILSIVSFQGARGIIDYVAAKTALLGITKSLSNELAGQGIQVNAIAPGYIETDMLKSLSSDEEHAAQMKGRIPIGRFGRPDEVVGAMIYLASKASDYVTGITVPVDGGWLAR
jgi:2-deoxy-D-gluconate 3-dehydrogenase